MKHSHSSIRNSDVSFDGLYFELSGSSPNRVEALLHRNLRSIKRVLKIDRSTGGTQNEL